MPATGDAAVIGIDLGTTNSVIAAVVANNVRVLVDAQGNQLHPSVVSFMPTGERLVGHRARMRRAVDPVNTIFSAKRIIGRPFRSRETASVISTLPYRVVEGENQQPMVVTRTGTLSVVDVTATVLIYLRQLAESQLSKRVTQCVITVPANFSDPQREATKQAVARAGMTPLRILNEPTAAALAYGTLQKVQRRIAVFDLGGGTFDVTLLAVRDGLYEVLATGGDPFLGGDDMDRAVADYLAEEFLAKNRVDLSQNTDSRARLIWAAEEIKKQLTARDAARGSIADIGYGPGGNPLTLEFDIDRGVFESRISLLVERAIETSARVLDSAQVLPRNVDEVILVGGSTLVPMVQRRVAEFFGRTPKCSINPMQVVAAGAAIHAASLASDHADGSTSSGGGFGGGLLLDVTSHSLGIATAGGYAESLIEKNTPIPAEGTRTFRPAKDGQKTIVIRVCQGESKMFDENTHLGEVRLTELSATARAESRVEVAFLVDANGMLQVSARDLTTGQHAKANLSILGVDPSRPDEAETETEPDGEVVP